jgi:hypothetical protein
MMELSNNARVGLFLGKRCRDLGRPVMIGDKGFANYDDLIEGIDLVLEIGV